MTHSKKWLWLVLLIGLTGWLGVQVYRATQSGQPEGQPHGRGRQRPPAVVEAAPVRKADLQDTRTFAGTLLPRSEFTVAPKISGRIRRLAVDVGDPVRNGQLVAVLDDEEYRHQIEETQAEIQVTRASLAEARISLDLARQEYKRASQLHLKKLIATEELEAAKAAQGTAQARLGVLQARIRQQETTLRLARLRLSYTRVHAAWGQGSGTRFVSRKLAEEGSSLPANGGLLAVVDTYTLRGLINVTEKDYPLIKPGQSVRLLTDAFPDTPFQARVSRIYPLFKEKARTAEVELTVPNSTNILKPGMFARAQVTVATRRQATVVPRQALVKQPDGSSGVFLIEAGGQKARFIPTEVGILTDKQAEIISPALSGQVVTLGSHLLKDGAPISLARSGGKPGGQRRRPPGP